MSSGHLDDQVSKYDIGKYHILYHIIIHIKDVINIGSVLLAKHKGYNLIKIKYNICFKVQSNDIFVFYYFLNIIFS